MPKPRVLVADDNPLTLRYFAEALALAGAEPAGAADGLQAVARAGAEAFDLLFLDVRMPRLDGAAALARIRAGTGPSRAAPAVATSAETTAALERTLRQAGFREVLGKPFGLESVRAVLRRHLPPDGLDDAQALAAAGGDASIVAALRGLLAQELDALPAELAGWSAAGDAAALRERLHRLDASAGFCGAPSLIAAAAALRAALAAPCWPAASVAAFLAESARVRGLLAPG